ncbi:hypothetical protein ACKWTF_013922 [Chironomus riparius]
MLREKTLEKIRKSMEAENERRSTATDNQTSGLIKAEEKNSTNAESISSKESKTISSKLPVENMPLKEALRISLESSIESTSLKEFKKISSKVSAESSESLIISSKLPIESISPKESARISSKFPAESMSPKKSTRISSILPTETEKPYRISDFPSVSQSIRVTTIQDDDIFDDIDKFHKRELERIQARKSTRESRYTEIFCNDICGSFEPLVNEDPIRDSKRSSKEQRYSNIYDNDMFGMPVDFRESLEFFNRDQLKLVTLEPEMNIGALKVPKTASSYHSSLECVEASGEKSSIQVPKLDLTQSTRVTRSTDVINNDILDSIALKTKTTQTSSVNGSKLSVVTIPQTKYDTRRSIADKRYTEIFDNDMLGNIKQQQDLIETSSRQSSEPRSIAPDLQSQISRKQSLSKISSDNLSEFIYKVTSAACEITSQLGESTCKIKQHDIVERSPTRHSCSQRYKVCSDSCTSHLKPHPCSLEAPLCSPSCATCKPFTESIQRSSAQYDADDERSSLLLNKRDIGTPLNSSIQPQQDQTPESSKIYNIERVCSCSQKYPELFENVLSK